MDRLRRLLPALLALALGLVVLGDGLRAGSVRFLGREYVDAWGTQWFYWFVERQVSAGEGFGQTDLFFHPWGKDVYLHTGGNILDAFVAWPFRALLGPVLGYNAFVVAILATNLLAMRHLLLRLAVKSEPATLAAVLFAFNPWALHELRDGRPTQALLAFVLYFFADYLSLGTDRRGWLPLRAGGWLAIAGLTYWYNALFAGIAAAVIGLWCTAVAADRRRTFLRHAAAGLAALVLVAPFAIPMLRSEDVPGLLDVSRWTLTTWSPTTKEGVKIGLYVFDPTTLTSGFWAMKNDGGMAFLRMDTNVFLVQVLLAALGLALAKTHRAVTIVLLAVSFVIAVGPQVFGLPNPLYIALAKSSSIFQRLWWPSRGLVLAHVGLAVAMGLGFARMRSLAPIVATAAAIWWGFSLRSAQLGPMTTWDADVPDAYRCLAEADSGAIVELPYAHTQAHLWYQTVHGRPLFGGMVEDNPVFSPPAQLAYQRDNTFVSVLLDQSTYGKRRPAYRQEDRAALQALGYRWVVLDKRAYVEGGDIQARTGSSLAGRANRVAVVMEQLVGRPVWEDADNAIYAPWGDGSPCQGAAATR